MFDIILWYITTFLLGILALPIGYYFLGKLSDYGYPFYRIIGVGLLSYITWLLVNFKLFKFNLPVIIVSVIILSAISGFILYKQKFVLPKDFIKKALIYELLFLALFVLFVWYRFYHSGIKDIEKFMDFAFVNAILRTDYFPPQDPWLAGNAINYYYFGHLITAILTKLTFIKSAVTFNLMVATNYVFYAVAIFSIVYNLTKKYFWAGVSIIVAAFMGNLSYFYGIFVKKEASVWWAEATRIIPGTINEFPLYSFLLGDLHAHYLNLPFALLTLTFLYLVIKENIKYLWIPMGILYSIMFVTNSWDFLIYMLFLGLALLSKNGLSLKGFKQTVKFGSLLTLISAIGIIPFYLFFDPGSKGFQIVTAPRTELKNFLLLFGLQMFVLSFYLIASFLKKVKDRRDFILPLLTVVLVGTLTYKIGQILPLVFILGFLLIILMYEDGKVVTEDKFNYLLIAMSFFVIVFCEMFYLKDIYGIEYQRANTIFKLYYQLWLYLSISIVYISYKVTQHFGKEKFVYLPVAFCLFVASIYYMPNSVKVSADNFDRKYGLDGSIYLKEKYPEDFAAITWLNANVKGAKVIAEKPGESYTDDSRVSTFTGLSTPLGWVGHEWGWHGSSDSLFEIQGDMQKLYNAESSEDAQKIIAQYNLDYIFVGALEQSQYGALDNPVLSEIGKTVYSTSNVRIIKVK
ncbi:MAG: hypothetical protein UT66_C0010G0006 [candidate division CPR2 bacterium GW2011_GWC1_39_9]|nr:MAG: hypothetical protein UT66_C0010G0006 [candidate division CPR2 bacterium GW2011_GWC1_39_9]